MMAAIMGDYRNTTSDNSTSTHRMTATLDDNNDNDTMGDSWFGFVTSWV